MRMICPDCKRTMKTFTPTEQERKFFDEEELKTGEAFHHRPCRTCIDIRTANPGGL